jgi:hypothetical protein
MILKKKDTKSTKTCFWGGGDFRFSPWVLESDPREKRGMTVLLIASFWTVVTDIPVFVHYRTDWLLDYQDVVCLAATQVWWTAEVENVLEKIKQVK